MNIHYGLTNGVSFVKKQGLGLTAVIENVYMFYFVLIQYVLFFHSYQFVLIWVGLLTARRYEWLAKNPLRVNHPTCKLLLNTILCKPKTSIWYPHGLKLLRKNIFTLTYIKEISPKLLISLNLTHTLKVLLYFWRFWVHFGDVLKAAL